jgi:hypothetical protein
MVDFFPVREIRHQCINNYLQKVLVWGKIAGPFQRYFFISGVSPKKSKFWDSF